MDNTAAATTPKLLLVDGHSLAFRSYYAFAKGRDGGLRTSTGIPTSVSYGFIKALLETIESEQPDHVAITFDLGGPTFRHKADETYKAGRAETPEDFIPDLDNLQDVLKAMNFQIVVVPGYEADDVIGTMSNKAAKTGWQVKVLSGDRDLFQLVDADERVKILYMSNSFGRANPPPKEFGIQEVKDKMGVFPHQVVDFKALCGDSSDNIPGVRGIGEKTATKLIDAYGTLDQVYASLDELKGAVKTKLENGEAAAKHSQWLAQICLDVPLAIELTDCKLTRFEAESIIPLIEKLEFRAFNRKIEALRRQLAGEPPEPKAARAKPTKTQESSDIAFFTAEETEKAQQVAEVTISPRIIDTPESLRELVEILLTYTDPNQPVAWDTETTSLEPRDAELVGIGCCWDKGINQLAYIPIGHHNGKMMDQGIVLEMLRPILENADYPKTLQNAKFDRLVFRFQGIELAGVIFDTMLASYVINPELKHNLSDLSLRYLDILAQDYKDLVPKGKTIADIEIQAVANYCGMDVYSTWQLTQKLRAELHKTPSLNTLFETIELPTEVVLADMESVGIEIDTDYLKEFSTNLGQDLDRIEQQAYSDAGSEFNLGSPKQLSELLFEKLELNTKKSRKTKTGYSTDAATLEKLKGDHPVVDAIVEYRSLSKLKSTYVDALPTLVRSDTHRVHTDFNQAVTATGRLSSSAPNLQNIPIRTAFSRQIRKAFLPRDGWLLAGADYSQIELRIVAHLSQEPALLEAYRTGTDVHTLTAKLLLEKEDISSDERRLAKIINFGVIYGMGAQRFAREAGVKNAEAKAFIDRFNERYSKVFAYLQQMQREAIANGYVETICGRRRYFNFNSQSLQQLRGSNPNDIDLDQIKLRDQYDAQMLRAAANAPIQGSSADIIKLAMIHLQAKLKPDEANLLLQVHDELVLEVAPEAWDSLRETIKTTMESAIELTVPLKVEIHAGKNWMEAK
ncbi:DNA polymerase I [filamentous cyanobacterium LEGE 11480]|uniref:DNA polymerase I n=1 Tax=Romeriopsis navalis LEGE 11480 TaxID=2777977 RepID=A0A928VKM5_9CYAN|nr:DNA polymerase I [Romeriopsis navalis]MBE9028346.1 DNA polymerase I [Romeriopsis navalis LEGE 11480]